MSYAQGWRLAHRARPQAYRAGFWERLGNSRAGERAIVIVILAGLAAWVVYGLWPAARWLARMIGGALGS